MTELPAYYAILSQPLSFWATNCDERGVPEIIRCCGISYLPDACQLTFFVGQQLSRIFVANTKANPHISLMGASLYTFESYQYKGRFAGLRPCTEEEIEFQRRYVDVFADTLLDVGYDWKKELVFKAFFHLPAIAIQFDVKEVFEQTPRAGTGMQVN